MANENEENHAAIRDFSYIFETMAEITKKYKKDKKEKLMLNFLLRIGPHRSVEMFTRIDQDNSGCVRRALCRLLS